MIDFYTTLYDVLNTLRYASRSAEGDCRTVYRPRWAFAGSLRRPDEGAEARCSKLGDIVSAHFPGIKEVHFLTGLPRNRSERVFKRFVVLSLF